MFTVATLLKIPVLKEYPLKPVSSLNLSQASPQALPQSTIPDLVN